MAALRSKRERYNIENWSFLYQTRIHLWICQIFWELGMRILPSYQKMDMITISNRNNNFLKNHKIYLSLSPRPHGNTCVACGKICKSCPELKSKMIFHRWTLLTLYKLQATFVHICLVSCKSSSRLKCHLRVLVIKRMLEL